MSEYNPWDNASTTFDPTFSEWLYGKYNAMYDDVYSQTSQEDDRELSPQEVEEARYLYGLIQAGEITQADLDYMESNFPDLYNYAKSSWESENPEPELTQWQKNKNTIITRVESGNASQADQDWYDRWVYSGEPDLQSGMVSEEQYKDDPKCDWPYAFVRIGEETDDIETKGNPWDFGIEIRRTIERY